VSGLGDPPGRRAYLEPTRRKLPRGALSPFISTPPRCIRFRGAPRSFFGGSLAASRPGSTPGLFVFLSVLRETQPYHFFSKIRRPAGNRSSTFLSRTQSLELSMASLATTSPPSPVFSPLNTPPSERLTPSTAPSAYRKSRTSPQPEKAGLRRTKTIFFENRPPRALPTRREPDGLVHSTERSDWLKAVRIDFHVCDHSWTFSL